MDQLSGAFRYSFGYLSRKRPVRVPFGNDKYAEQAKPAAHQHQRDHGSQHASNIHERAPVSLAAHKLFQGAGGYQTVEGSGREARSNVPLSAQARECEQRRTAVTGKGTSNLEPA